MTHHVDEYDDDELQRVRDELHCSDCDDAAPCDDCAEHKETLRC